MTLFMDLYPLIINLFYDNTAGESCTLQPFGKCSHFCTEEIGSAIGYTCSCEVGYSLQLDGFVCLANGEYW